MNNEREKINLDDALDELSLDELENIAGGKISAPGYALVAGAVVLFKSKGYSKDECIKEMIAGWNRGSTFRYKLTDGTNQDMQDMVDYINSIW